MAQGWEQLRGCQSRVGNMKKFSTWKRVRQALIQDSPLEENREEWE